MNDKHLTQVYRESVRVLQRVLSNCVSDKKSVWDSTSEWKKIFHFMYKRSLYIDSDGIIHTDNSQFYFLNVQCYDDYMEISVIERDDAKCEPIGDTRHLIFGYLLNPELRRQVSESIYGCKHQYRRYNESDCQTDDGHRE